MKANSIDKNQRIQECVLNIDMVTRSLFFSYESLKELNVPLQSQVSIDIIQYSYIRICTILDEVGILHGIAKEDPYLHDTLYCAQPALIGIGKYSGLRKARNLMLAHLNRDSKKQFTPWWEELLKLKLPRTYKEFNQILVFLNIINSILVSRYQNKFDIFTASVRPAYEAYFDAVKKMEEDISKNGIPSDNVQDEIQKRCKEKGLINFLPDPAMVKYWKHSVIRHFTPRKMDDILKMNDSELKALPEFRLATMEYFEKEESKRMAPLKKHEIEEFETKHLTRFREMLKNGEV